MVSLLAQVYNGGGVDDGVDQADDITGVSTAEPREVVANIIAAVLNYLALIATIMVIVAGIYLIVSLGNDDNKDKAKKIIYYTIIGLLVVLFARVIVSLVTVWLPGENRMTQLTHPILSFILNGLLVSQSMLLTVSAQEDLHGAAGESLTLKVGDILEILPVHDLPSESSYTWILTQDRTFLEATRAPIFRKRLIQPGVYTLFADIVSPDGSGRITRTFTIDYQARQPGEPLMQNGVAGSGMLVTTVPPMDTMGRTALAKETQLVRLNPVYPDITPLALDLDLNRDADGDGSNDNDIQGNDTFFASDATPLYLWIANDSLSRHPVSVTASLPDGARVQKIEILEESLARAEGVVQGPVTISAEKTSGRSYRFTAVFQGTTPAGGQLLYQWQFGDGQQSLINAPEHEYAENGDYTVQLSIRNLRDGKEMANTSTIVNVSGSGQTPSSEPTQNSSEDTEAPIDNKGSSFNLQSILLLVGIFVGSLVVGAIIMTLIFLLRRNKGSVAKKIEELEKAVVKPADNTPAPLAITPPASVPTSGTAAGKPPAPAAPVTTPAPQPKQQTPPTVAKREEERATSNPATQPAQTVNAKATPAWLQQPTTPAQPPIASTPKPTPAPQLKPQTPPPAPKPQSTPVPQTPKQPTPAPPPKPQSAPVQAPQQQQNRPAPAWLQQSNNAAPTPAPQTPQQQQKPAQPIAPPAPQMPKPQPAPVVAPAPVQPPVPTSAVQAEPVPSKVEGADRPTPKPTEPAMTPAVPVQTPVPPAPVEQPKPATPATPPAPEQQKPVDLPIPQETKPAADQPIAIIRAESLNPENQQNG